MIFVVTLGLLVNHFSAAAFCPFSVSRVSRSFVRHVGANDDDNDNDDDDTSFYRALEEAKKSKLGGFIPEGQLKESASNAESEFLAAMKQARKEFDEAKERFGSQVAVDMFLNKIRKEQDETDDEDLEFHGEFQ